MPLSLPQKRRLAQSASANVWVLANQSTIIKKNETTMHPYLKQLNQHYQANIATEHTHRPALKTLLEDALPGVLVTNEPKQIECGAPDFVLTRKHIPLGYIEAKDLGKNLDDPAHQPQLKRYTESLGNLLFTNYLQFRLIRDGKPVAAVTIGEIVNGKITSKPKNFAEFSALKV